MTRRKDLKKRVRAQQQVTGERYTRALDRVQTAAARPKEAPALTAAQLARPIVYRVDRMNHVAIRRNLVYRRDGRVKLLMDVQTPPRLPSSARLPAVLFVHGGPVPESAPPPKGWGVFQSYGALAAASGLAGVTFNHRLHGPRDYGRSQEDIAAAVAFVRENATDLHIDPDRLALWVFSGGGPQVSWVLRERPPFIRCLVAFYALLDLRHLAPGDPDPTVTERIRQWSPTAWLTPDAKLPPVFVARAGLDSGTINLSIDRFVREALAVNAPLDLANHATGRHSFDVLDDDERSREIIARAIAFIQAHA